MSRISLTPVDGAAEPDGSTQAAPPSVIYLHPPLPDEAAAAPRVLIESLRLQVVLSEAPATPLESEPGSFKPEGGSPQEKVVLLPAATDAPMLATQLAELSTRLDLVKPPHLWGEELDQLRIWGWRKRQVAARTKWHSPTGETVATAEVRASAA